MEIADKCPVHRTLTSEIEIRTVEERWLRRSAWPSAFLKRASQRETGQDTEILWEIRKPKVSRAHLKSRSESLSCQCINMTKLAALVVVSGVVGATDCQRIAEPSTISVHELHTVAHAQGLPIQNFEDQSLIDSWRERYRRSVFCCSIYCERVGWTVGSARRLGSTLP